MKANNEISLREQAIASIEEYLSAFYKVYTGLADRKIIASVTELVSENPHSIINYEYMHLVKSFLVVVAQNPNIMTALINEMGETSYKRLIDLFSGLFSFFEELENDELKGEIELYLLDPVYPRSEHDLRGLIRKYTALKSGLPTKSTASITE